MPVHFSFKVARTLAAMEVMTGYFSPIQLPSPNDPEVSCCTQIGRAMFCRERSNGHRDSVGLKSNMRRKQQAKQLLTINRCD
jgi:hypothetical protein